MQAIALRILGVLGLLLIAAAARAQSAQHLLERYAQEVKQVDPSFAGFSPENGRKFYLEKHPLMGVGAVACSSCHRKNPREEIRAHRTDILCRACHVINDEEHPDPAHAKKRLIQPFAPSANPKRFSDYERVEKYFRTNCAMTLKRPCTPQEKGDLIAWLLTLDGGPISGEEARETAMPKEE
ncbi:MAG TPA: DUF1924 domain-containing protein [Burkholderiales bacterium]|nr:DUF1924 domain-containing protein [Burkholderiales bacterium]